MSNQNFNSLLAESQPSLCIPRVFNNITELRIRKIFNELSLGKISRIDMTEHKNEKGTFNRVYIHFEKWFCNENAKITRKKLILGNEIKIIYDNPWFWKVSASKWEPPSKSKNLQVNVQEPSKKKSAYIEFDHNNECGRDLSITDLNTDQFGRDLSITDLNTDQFGRDLSITDLNTDQFGRDLSIKRDLNNTDEYGRDLSLKRDYERVQELDRCNRRRHNNAIIEPVPVEEEIQERKLIPFVSITEDLDNLDNLRFEIDYGTPLPVPKKMNRKPLNKSKVEPKKASPPIRINWCDDNDTDDEEDEEKEEEEEIDIYADLDINL